MNGSNVPVVIENDWLVLSHFAHWPSFHDAEIISMKLIREGPVLQAEVYTFEITGTKDERGFYKRENACYITLTFEEISDTSLADFNHQNVIAGLRMRTVNDSVEVWMDALYGLTCHFLCKRLRVESVIWL